MLNLMALTLLAVIVKNPNMIQNFDDAYDDEPIPTPVSRSVESQTPLPSPSYNQEASHYRDHSLEYHDMDMGGLVCLCMIAICLMLIHGTIKGRPSHLLPFFFLQLCDFALTTLTAAGYLCYLRAIHSLIEKSNKLPWKEHLVEIDQRTLGIIVLLAFIFMVMLKAYTIGIVWRCYKYLTILQNAALLSYIAPTGSHRERSFNSLLPNYEEAMKVIPPPSYQAAMQHQPVAAAAATHSLSAAASVSEISEPPNYSTLDLRAASSSSTASSPTNSNSASNTSSTTTANTQQHEPTRNDGSES